MTSPKASPFSLVTTFKPAKKINKKATSFQLQDFYSRNVKENRETLKKDGGEKIIIFGQLQEWEPVAGASAGRGGGRELGLIQLPARRDTSRQLWQFRYWYAT